MHYMSFITCRDTLADNPNLRNPHMYLEPHQKWPYLNLTEVFGRRKRTVKLLGGEEYLTICFGQMHSDWSVVTLAKRTLIALIV